MTSMQTDLQSFVSRLRRARPSLHGVGVVPSVSGVLPVLTRRPFATCSHNEIIVGSFYTNVTVRWVMHMTGYQFPLPFARSLVERVHGQPDGPRRRWVLRDDNQQHYHGRVPLSEDPLLLELCWKADSRSREQVVGLYRLHLSELLEAGYVRRESDAPVEADVRLRFFRGDRGVVYIQARADQPALAVGVVDRALS